MLPPYATALQSDVHGSILVGNDWTQARFDGPFVVSSPLPDRPACSLVFVQSADGNTGAKDPGTLGGGATDKHVIYEGLSRVAADGILAGAETVRSGSIVLSVWHPELVALRSALGKPRHPIQIVATLRGVDITRGVLYNVPSLRVIIITVRAVVERMRAALDARPWIEVVAIDGPGDMPGAFAELRARRIGILSCIGGRRLAGALLDANLVDDVYLTTAPHAGGEPGTPLESAHWSGAVVLRKHGTGPERGVVFEQIHCAEGAPYFPVAHA